MQPASGAEGERRPCFASCRWPPYSSRLAPRSRHRDEKSEEEISEITKCLRVRFKFNPVWSNGNNWVAWVEGARERRGIKNKLKSPLTLKLQRCPAWTLTLCLSPLERRECGRIGSGARKSAPSRSWWVGKGDAAGLNAPHRNTTDRCAESSSTPRGSTAAGPSLSKQRLMRTGQHTQALPTHHWRFVCHSLSPRITSNYYIKKI